MSGDQEDPKNFAGMREPSDATPGYYWARYRDEEEDPAAWVPVEWDGDEVYECGSEMSQALKDWELGPRLVPPEEKSEDSP